VLSPDAERPTGRALNEALISRLARREKLVIAMLAAPALVLVAVLLMLPVGWLFAMSFVEKGSFSFAHYSRMAEFSSYWRILLTTFQVSGLVTLICVLLGYPVAYLLTQVGRRLALILLSLVIVPFWTSLLVRTYAWLIILRDAGPINETLRAIGLIEAPLPLLFNVTGTVIGMVHIMLPFFILPVYSVIRGFDWSLMDAAAGLGASPISAFWRVFMPLSLPGVMAGAVLVFVQCLGFYVTPAVLGGGKVTMVAMKIASNVQQYFDWGAASALGVVLLAATLAILILAYRLVDLDRVLGVR